MRGVRVDELIRAVLRDKPDGATLMEVARMLHLGEPLVRYHIQHLPDAYIDRWTAVMTATKPAWAPVYCCLERPPNAPKPDRAPTPDDIERTQP